MTFCWRRFRHFVAAYFALGLAATVMHGALVFASLEDVVADATETAPESVDVDLNPSVDVPSEAPVDLAETEVTTAPVEGASDDTATTDPTLTEGVGTDTDTVSDTVPAAEVVTDLDPNTDNPAEEAASDSDTIPTDSAEVTEVSPQEETAEITEGTEPIAETPEGDTSDAISEPSADSWPEERIGSIPEVSETPTEDAPEPEVTISEPVVETEIPEVVSQPIIAEDISPYIEVRSTIEGVLGKLDWLYTLRADANYDLIDTTKIQSATDLVTLIEILEAQSPNDSINSQFCNVENDLSSLYDLLAPDSDDTQLDVDADNSDYLAEIQAAVSLVRLTWQTETGSAWQCN